MKTWNIRVTNPAPSMSQTRTVFQAETYADAVAVAHEAYRTHGRAVVLGDGEYGLYAWHRVDSAGVATDRNTNSGIPATQQVDRFDMRPCETCGRPCNHTGGETPFCDTECEAAATSRNAREEFWYHRGRRDAEKDEAPMDFTEAPSKWTADEVAEASSAYASGYADAEAAGVSDAR